MKGIIRPDSLIGTYLRLKEAGAPSDFPSVMANVQYKLLLLGFKGLPTFYDKWCKLSDVNDFKTNDRTWLSEADDLKEVQPGGGYLETKLKDRKYQITLKTFGRTFNLLRQTVINDDLQAFKDVPKKLGRAAKRKVAKSVCEKLETNGNAYDANPLFGSRSNLANQSFTALTADATGIAAVNTGISAIARATDPDTGEIVGAMAKYLVTSPLLAETAKWITNSTNIGRGSTDAPTENPLKNPAMASPIEPVIEPWLTAFPSRWYLLADPEEFPTVEVSFLDGQREPELFMKDADSIRISGSGRDEFGYDYDDINYKVRYDFGVAIAMYQGAFKGGN